tara:strand:+ start:379 stop:585 length:207 start_codon:yes stop_codon:yes gene_type:complete
VHRGVSQILPLVGLNMDAADYGADGMACHRGVSYLNKTNKRQYETASESAKKSKKVKVDPLTMTIIKV